MKKEKFNKVFGEFVRRKRQQHSITQIELSDRIGNNFQNISRLERGELAPTLYWVNNLAEAFEQNLSDFITEFQEYISEQ